MPNNSYNPGPGTAALLGGFLIVYLVIVLALIVFSLIIYWKIFSKAGYSGAMSLLMFVPIANLVVLCILAFGEWPIYRELNQLRQMARSQQYPQGPQYQQNPQYQNPQYRG
jgi:glycerol-3-phosphate acyltransferase PlsY